MKLSKAQIKYLLSLQQKKIRQKNRFFVLEGEKMAKEVLLQKKIVINAIYATADWVENHRHLMAQYKSITTIISHSELKKISSLKTPNQVLMVLPMFDNDIKPTNIKNSLSLVLENVQDPGNMGTIIRIADWFGIDHIFCSIGCVDIYNPKVVQATMGGLLRVKIHYTPLEQLFDQYPNQTVYGAILGGKNVFQTQLEAKGFLLIGNEGKGLTDGLQKYITKPITIPKFGQAESLNAAVATGILCAMFRV